MLEALRVRRRIVVRLRSGPFGPWIDDFVKTLAARGYAGGSQRYALRGADVLAAWITRHHIAVSALDETVVVRFCHGLRRWPCRTRARGRANGLGAAARVLASYLWGQGVASRRPAPSASSAIDQWVDRFDRHLDRAGGLSVGTRRIYGRYARALLTACWPTGQADWRALTAECVSTFVQARAATLRRTASRLPVTSTRRFVRFLVAEGVIRPGLDGAIPVIRQWKQAALPRALTPADVERVLQVPDADTTTGVRDAAILLLLSRLGLRAGEVAGLHLADVDWREGRLHIRAGKTGRPRDLPLPEPVGAALVRVVTTRPRHLPHDRVFLAARPPSRPLTAAAVTGLAQRHLRRAGITVARLGAHAFRHTVASTLVQHGISMKAVADVLGHADVATTTIYAKLDVATLAGVALPWPGGGQ